MTVSTRKKKTFGRRLAYRAEYLLARILLGLLGWIPLGLQESFAGGLARVLCWTGTVRRSVLDENLQTAFGRLDQTERSRLTLGILTHTILWIVELARLRKATPDEVLAAFPRPVDGEEHVQALRRRGHGFLLASAHLGNWEWFGAWYALAFGDVGFVYKPMHNPKVDGLACAMRRRFGVRIFSTRERTPRALVEHIRRGGAAAILADQDARRAGVFLPFFGKPASTAVGLASLSIRLNAPVIPSFCFREKGGRFRVRTFDPIWPDPAADRSQERIRITRAYLEAVERAVREEPEQYFWWHRRWKTRPRREDNAVAPESAEK